LASTNDVNTTLAERGRRYGDFMGHARYTQAIKRVFQSSPNWAVMDDDQREALEMVAHKMGRILNGDPNYPDSWHDMAGYPKLVDDRLTNGSTPGLEAPSSVPATDTFRPVSSPIPASPAPAAPAPAPLPPVKSAAPATAPGGPIAPPAPPAGGPVKS
jgi:hypothetical protein